MRVYVTVSRSAVMMSEILHYLCQLDAITRSRSSRGGYSPSSDTRERISPLVFVVRQWVRSVGVTSTTPGTGFTNFMLTILVVFFLQTRRLPLLPALGSLKSTTTGLCALVNLIFSSPIYRLWHGCSDDGLLQGYSCYLVLQDEIQCCCTFWTCASPFTEF